MSEQETIDLGIEGLSAAVHLGAGGSANVFAARRLDTGEHVAVKLLRASADSEKERRRFEREKETLDRLSTRDGIVPILDAGMTDRKEPYFLMPIMEGSLQDRIESEGALDWETASQLMVQVAETVEFAHEQSVLHRDLKPGNILVDQEGVPRVADFGIAKLLDTSTSKSSKSMGTPSFMPPERFRGDEATEVSDVYGLGATLAALVTGTPPFITGENDTDAAVMMRVVNDAPPDLSAEPDIPHPVADLVTVSMAKDPADRPASAAEFANRLRAAVTNSGAAVPAAPVTVAVPRRNLDLAFAAAGDAGATGSAVAATNGSNGAAVTTGPTEPIVLTEEDDDDRAPAAWMQFAGAAVVVFLVGLAGIFFLARDNGASEDAGPETVVQGATEETTTTEVATVAAPPPEACFGASSTASVIGETVSFSTCTDESVTYEWDFGDGTTATGSEVSHTWDEPGTYAVRLTARDDRGEDTTTRAITIDPPTITIAPEDAPIPVACFNVTSATVQVGQPVSFSNCSDDASSYNWSFGDGQTSTWEAPTHYWSRPGTYMVEVTAEGPGGMHSVSRSVTVTAATAVTAAPSENTSSPTTEDPGNNYEPGTTDAPGATDAPATTDAPGGGNGSPTPTDAPAAPAPDACFTASSTSVEVNQSVSFSNCSSDASSYHWDFGDGEMSYSASASHSWDAAGTYSVRLTAEGDGGTDTATRTITVTSPEPEPVACFTASATTVTVNQSVSFSNCSDDATSYSWDFGDGSTSTSASASHSWSSADTYTVRLTATGPGGTDSTTRSITVNAAQPSPDFVGTIEIGDLDETFVKYRFRSDTTTTYTAVVKQGGSTVASASGTATADQLVNITANGLTADTDYTIQVTLAGSPAATGTATIRTPGGTPPVTTTPVQLLNLRITDLGSTRVQLNYESNVCANGSFVISKSGGGQVGSNAGQSDGCGTNHLAIPGFWTNALEPNTTYTITITVEANGRGQGNGNTDTQSMTFTTSG